MKDVASPRQIASDPDFWRLVNLAEIELIMLALTNHQENLLVGDLLNDLGYQGQLAAVVRFPEEAGELEQHGISTFNLYAPGWRPGVSPPTRLKIYRLQVVTPSKMYAFSRDVARPKNWYPPLNYRGRNYG